MILAGIDEAGYGPLLGPLVVGCCAFEIEDIADPFAPLPCLWKRLRKHISKKRSPNHRRIHVNDSKQVYSPAIGIGQLERAILALMHAAEIEAATFDAMLAGLCPDVLTDLPHYPWYDAGDAEKFPLENDALSIQLFAKSLRLEMLQAQTRCVHLFARVVLERQLNRMVAATRNKASVLFSTAAMHIEWLLYRYADQGLLIFCDRQGGREHYGSLLRMMFADWSLEVISEIDGRAEYRMSRSTTAIPVRIIFTEKAEAQCLPVAVASMISKYLREGLMHRFNRFWKIHLPNLTPTAGYYNDGLRFLSDISTKRAELGIADDQLVRSR